MTNTTLDMVLVAEVNRLRADLTLNAQMLAKQTDLAREAEHTLTVTIRDMNSDVEMWQIGTATLTAERDAARRAHLTCQEAWEALSRQRDLDVDRAREAETALAEERAEHEMTRTVCRSLRDELSQLRLCVYEPEGTGV